MTESAAGDWVLDPSASTVSFVARSFWGAMPVRGTFSAISGTGTVSADGAIGGELVIGAATLDTRQKQRDKHLRSADFFNAEKYPDITVTVASATLDGSSLACRGTMSAAGQTVPIAFTAHVEGADDSAAVLRADLVIMRSKFGMTWQQLPGMIKDAVRGTVTARFVRR